VCDAPPGRATQGAVGGLRVSFLHDARRAAQTAGRTTAEVCAHGPSEKTVTEELENESRSQQSKTLARTELSGRGIVLARGGMERGRVPGAGYQPHRGVVGWLPGGPALSDDVTPVDPCVPFWLASDICQRPRSRHRAARGPTHASAEGQVPGARHSLYG